MDKSAEPPATITCATCKGTGKGVTWVFVTSKVREKSACLSCKGTGKVAVKMTVVVTEAHRQRYAIEAINETRNVDILDYTTLVRGDLFTRARNHSLTHGNTGHTGYFWRYRDGSCLLVNDHGELLVIP